MKAGKVRFDQDAPAREPIVQNLIVKTLSALAPREMIKLAKAIKRALTTVPDKIKLDVVDFPCMVAISKTEMVARSAPIKAATPVKALRPKMILSVAPKVAPEEIPRM